MKRLKYIGLKQDGERAFQDRTGIEWTPGAEHDVKDEDAALMLPHTDVWCEVPVQAPALASAPSAPPKAETSVLPAWVKSGVELGANDDQLEGIAQAGGPETEAGAALWKDATGADFKPAESKPEATQKPSSQKSSPKPAAKKTSRRGAKE